MIDIKTAKLMEVCLKLHYAINPHLILRESTVRHLILEKTELIDALDISRDKLATTLVQVEEVYDIVDGLFKKAMDNKNNTELIPDSNVLDGYFDALRKSIDDNQNKLNQLQAMGAKLDSPKNYKTISNISAKALENQSSLQGFTKSIATYMEEMSSALARQNDGEATVLSTLDPKAVGSTLKNVSSQLRAGYKGKDQSTVAGFFSKIGAKFSGALNPNPVFDEVAKVLMLIPLNTVKEEITKLDAAETKIEETTKEVAETTKEITDNTEPEKSSDSGAEPEKPSESGDAASSDYISKVIDAWADKLDAEKTFGGTTVKNVLVNTLKKSTPKFKSALESTKNDLKDRLKNDVQKLVDDYFKTGGAGKMAYANATKQTDFKSSVESLNNEITDAILQLKFESTRDLSRSKLKRIVHALLDHRFKNSNLIKESAKRTEANQVNSIDFRRINQLSGLED